MNNKLILLILISTFTVNTSFAQQQWTLRQCINHALSNNIQIKQQALNTQYSENVYTQSKAWFLPAINAGSDYNVNFGRAVDPYTNEFSESRVETSNFYVTGSLTLFNGMKKFYTLKKSKLDLFAGMQDYEKLKNDVALNIATLYLQILFNKEMLKLAENQFTLSQKQTIRVEKLVNAGQLPQGNYLEMLAQNATDELQLINARNELGNSILNLKQMLDLKDTLVFDIAEPEISENVAIIPYNIDEVYTTALMLPQIKAADYRLSAAEYELDIARSNSLPVLSLNATYATGFSDARKNLAAGDSIQIPIGFLGSTNDLVYTIQPTYTESSYPFIDQINDNANKSVGLRLSIPIFNGLQVKTAIQNSKINIENNRLLLENEKNELYKDIQKALFDLNSASVKFQSSQKSLQANKESFSYTEKKFNLGLLNTNDYNLARNNLINAESTLIQAKYEYLFKKYIVDFYAGKPVTE